MKRERRKYPRRRLTEKTFLALDRHSAKLARLSDLSAEGMQLSYTPGNGTGHHWTSVDIVTGVRHRLIIPGVACKTVYDVASLMENGSFSGAALRISGIQFDRLTDAQKRIMDFLLTGGAGD